MRDGSFSFPEVHNLLVYLPSLQKRPWRIPRWYGGGAAVYRVFPALPVLLGALAPKGLVGAGGVKTLSPNALPLCRQIQPRLYFIMDFGVFIFI